MQSAVIDRIVDGKTAVLLVGEQQQKFYVPLRDLPPGCQEGFWLLVRLVEGKLGEAQIDQLKTEESQKRIRAKLESLRRRGRHPG